jgi:rod shape-determining protein MreC
VLGVLVGASLILLTAYFGESPSSPLHSVQRGIVEVLSPVQEGASKVLSPVRDVAQWFSDTFRAKSKLAQYKQEVSKLTQQLAQYHQAAMDNPGLRAELGLNATNHISAYTPVAANVYERDPQLWYSQILVDKGSSDGVHANDPVISQNGLIGKVLTALPTVSVVALITNSSMSVTAEVQNQVGDIGQLVPAVGNPTQMLLTGLPSHAQISVGQIVVTAGFKSGKYDSLYPVAIPIGTVTNASQAGLENNQQVEVQPLVDLRHITSVQILTRPSGNGTQSAGVGGITTTAQVGG